jgi:hypothetical protein
MNESTELLFIFKSRILFIIFAYIWEIKGRESNLDIIIIFMSSCCSNELHSFIKKLMYLIGNSTNKRCDNS